MKIKGNVSAALRKNGKQTFWSVSVYNLLVMKIIKPRQPTSISSLRFKDSRLLQRDTDRMK